jgi:Tol biopolymer transport system component
MNADGTGVRQLTTNKVDDFGPVLSPDKSKVAYHSYGKLTSNPEGDYEIYVMNASEGTAKRNLTNNRADVNDFNPLFSPGGKKIAYTSSGKRASNPEGDSEVYVMRSLDGTGQKNLTNNGLEVPGDYPVSDYASDFSPTGDKIAYVSYDKQGSNPEGDDEIYSMSALDGKNKKNLTNNQDGVNDSYPVFSPGGKKIAYHTDGKQTSNLDGDYDVYRMSALDGTGQTNLTDNKEDVDNEYPYFSSDGTKIFYESEGVQDSNLQGDAEIYRLNTSDGKGKKNLTDNEAFDGVYPD